MAGSTNSDTDLFDVYWDAEVNRLSDSSEAVGDNEGSTNVTSGEFNLQTSDMQGSNAESEMSELDFDNVWTTTSGYPEFQWQE